MKLKYISNIPAPYVIEMLNEISKSCEVEGVFEAEVYNNYDKKWYSQEKNKFEVTFLKKGEIDSRSINWRILKYVNRNQDLLIMTCFSEFTEMIGFIVAKILRIPYWLESDGGQLHPEPIWKKWIKSFLISGAQGYISSGKTTDEYLRYYGAPADKICRYPFSSLHDEDILETPISIQKKKCLRKELGLNGERIIISVGRFGYIDKSGNEVPLSLVNKIGLNKLKLGKGFDILIDAVKKLPPDCKLVIIGGQPPKHIMNDVERAELNGRVKFIPFVEKQDVFKYYQAADLFCLQTRGDAWGLVINEAMANGLPVITTNKCVAGLDLVENDINGYIVPVEDGLQLATKMERLLSDKELRERMGKNNLAKIRMYTIENMAKVHVEILERKNCNRW